MEHLYNTSFNNNKNFSSNKSQKTLSLDDKLMLALSLIDDDDSNQEPSEHVINFLYNYSMSLEAIPVNANQDICLIVRN